MRSFPDDDLADDVRRVFEEFDRRHGANCPRTPSLYAPALDVIETATHLEVHVDVPGVAPDALRVLFKDGSLAVIGEKLAGEPCGPNGSAFHLVERGFGRFARVVRLSGAFDASRAEAVLHSGELRVAVPRIDERRGREIIVQVHEQKGPA